MRLSAAFNFFDGGELLVSALQNIRPHVQHISLVTQETSNYGNKISKISTTAIEEALKLGLVDTLVTFTPDINKKGSINEYNKRRLGVKSAVEAKANYIIFCDVDEFYKSDQFKTAKQFIVENRIDYSTVIFENYYVKPRWKLKVEKDYNGPKFSVPFICKLTDKTLHNYCGWYPIDNLDPTRRIYVKDGKHHHFCSSQIKMHHMTGVRLDLEEKLLNSSCNDDSNVIWELRNNFKLLPNLTLGIHTLPNGEIVSIEEVPDHFNLKEKLSLH